MSSAFLYPGQGSQEEGMGQDLYHEFPAVRRWLARADDILGFSITDIMFGEKESGSGNTSVPLLQQTQNTQPALYAHSIAVQILLDEAGIEPDRAAGHSLGEYSALAAAGAMTYEDGLRVVARRGALMAEAGQDRTGTMAALIGIDDDSVSNLCEDVTQSGTGVVKPANYNSPGQIVISGDTEAVERAVEKAEEYGARRAISLSVSGAFHSPLMAEAREGLAERLQKLDLGSPRWPVYLNVTGKPTTDPGEIRQGLIDQLTSPVRWSQTLKRMHEASATDFFEIGVGKVLSGLVRRTLGREVSVHRVGTSDQLKRLRQKV